jgi:fructose/tagatose bisphosphate aldolase
MPIVWRSAQTMVRKTFDVDKMVTDLAMTNDIVKKKEFSRRILETAANVGAYPASAYAFYMARGRAEFGGFTVPAINLRTLTYELARAVFRVAKRNHAGAFVFEIARSEIGYTSQTPVEYAGMVMAAAIAESYSGPVFIQGDHFQVNAAKFKEDSEKETANIRTLISDAVAAGFYNIDIDSSTLVDVTKADLLEQQFLNYDVCAKLTRFIRSVEPRTARISVGGEIGEIGTRNSTPDDLHAFMTGLKDRLGSSVPGISKISVQTGTTHGGVVLPDGFIKEVDLDFNTLKTLSISARKEYGLAGAVQHGASTLPPEAFHKFVECETAEVHLATEFQNMVYESQHFPVELKKKIYEWLKVNAINEAKVGETQEQFLYKTRKKALGPFKKEIMALPKATREAIAGEVEKKFEFLFKQLNVVDKENLVEKYALPAQ